MEQEFDTEFVDIISRFVEKILQREEVRDELDYNGIAWHGGEGHPQAGHAEQSLSCSFNRKRYFAVVGENEFL